MTFNFLSHVWKTWKLCFRLSQQKTWQPLLLLNSYCSESEPRQSIGDRAEAERSKKCRTQVEVCLEETHSIGFGNDDILQAVHIPYVMNW